MKTKLLKRCRKYVKIYKRKRDNKYEVYINKYYTRVFNTFKEALKEIHWNMTYMLNKYQNKLNKKQPKKRVY